MGSPSLGTMTVWLLLLFGVLAALIGVYKWKAHTSEVRSVRALQLKQKLATERLEKAIGSTRHDSELDSAAATVRSKTAHTGA
jgi:hypothetical protein